MSLEPAEQRSGIRARWWFWLCLAGVTAPYLVGLWSVRFVPLLDYPANLGVAAELAGLLRGAEGAGDLQLAIQPWPQFLVPLLWGALGCLLDVDVVGRLLISAVVILLPLSLSYLLQTLGRPRWPALAVNVLACGPLLVIGLINYLAAMPLLLLGLALVVKASTTRRQLALTVLFTLLLFSTHLMVCLIFVAVAPLLVALGEERPRIGRALPVLGGGVVGCLATVIPWWMHFRDAPSPMDRDLAWFSVAGVPDHVTPDLAFDLVHRQLMLPGYQWLVLLVLGLLLASAGRTDPMPARQRAQLLLPAMLLLGAAILVPQRSGTTGMISDRVVFPLAIFGLALLPCSAAPLRDRRLPFAALLAGLALVASLSAWHLHCQQQKFEGLAAHLMAVPRQSRLLTLPQYSRRFSGSWSIHRHLGGTFTAAREAVANLEFPWIPTSWVQYRASSPRRANSAAGRDQTIDGLDELSSRWYELALTTRLERPPYPRGPFRPALQSGDFVLYVNTAAGGRIELPVIDRLCATRSTADGGLVAECRHALSWSDARSSCRRWGGDLAGAGPDSKDLREGAMPFWLGARFDPRGERWLGLDGQPLAGLPVAADCLATDGAGFRRTLCASKALALCRRPRSVRRPAGRRWDVLAGSDEQLLLSRDPMTRAQALRACRDLSGQLFAPRQRNEWRYLDQVAAAHDLVSFPLWAEPQASSIADTPVPWAPGQPGAGTPACLLSDRTIEGCDRLHPFVCRKRSRQGRGQP